MLVLFAVSLGLLAYVLVGYPLLLRFIVAVRGPRPVRHAPIAPPVSFVISAFNEAAVIGKKIDNTLSLDYPAEARQIVVISDCSDDGTDEIVQRYADRGVTLARMAVRRGKTAGLNATVPTLTGDVVVFSDANAIYETDAVRKLVRNFADPDVGCVTGEARYLKSGEAAADVGERAYWGYEMHMKRLETRLGSTVGGDGAIYAIRRSLWKTLPDNAINDFLNPLQIVAAGWRGVYEPEAVAWEETAGGVRTEYRRRVRIVSRSWRAVFQAGRVLNPFAVGLFAWSLWSHKVLRWASGLFVAGTVVSGGALLVQATRPWSLWAAVAIVGLALLAGATTWGRRLFGTVGYFAVINAASLLGIWRGSVGDVSGIWSTPRAAGLPQRPMAKPVMVGRLFLWATLAVSVAMSLLPAALGYQTARAIFWVCLAVLAYVYGGYPLILAVVQTIRPRPVHKEAIEPTVTLLVAANDEAEVMEAKLENALALDYPPERLRIVIASDGSTDGTNEIVRRFAPRVRLLEFTPRQGKIAAINRSMASIDSDVVVFSDANTFLDAGSIRALVRSFADPSVGCVSGDVTLVGERAALGPSEDLYYLYERWVQRAESSIGSMVGADGALYAIRRELFEPQPADTILDDVAIPMGVVRRGYRAVFEPLAHADEQGVDSAWEEFGRKSRVVAGAIQFLRRPTSAIPGADWQVIASLVSHKALRWLSPALATLLLLSSVALATSSSRFAAVAQTQGLLIVVGLSGCQPALRRIPPVALAHYVLLVQAAAAAGFIKGLAGRQSVLWRRFGRPRPDHGRA